MTAPNIPRRAEGYWSADGRYITDPQEYLKKFAEKQQEALDSFADYLAENAELLGYVASRGDGEGGHLIDMLKNALFGPQQPTTARYRKGKIPARLRTAVFERDKYRCVFCGDHMDLCADHIHPEARGGETTFENLQTLCRPCNTSKGTKVMEVSR